MTYDFSHHVNSPKIEEAYPPLFLDFYAELKDILHIDDTKALHKFLNGDLCASMVAEMAELLPPMDWASQDNIKDFIAETMDRTREKFENIYRNDYVEAKGILRNMDLEAILHDLQTDMATVATCVTELVIGWKDTRIEKDNCKIQSSNAADDLSEDGIHIFVPSPDIEEYKKICEKIMPWLKFSSLSQVAGFLFRGDPLELSETITDEFNDLNAQQKRDLEHLIDATLDKISEEQRGEYSKLCKGVVSVRHAPNEKALSVIKGNLKAEMKIACTNIAIGVMAVQDHYIFPEDLKLNP